MLTKIKRAVFAKGKPIQKDEWWDLCRENEPDGDVFAAPFEKGDSITIQSYKDAPHEGTVPFHRRLSSRRYISEVDEKTRTATAGRDIAALLTVYWYHKQHGKSAEGCMKNWVSKPGMGMPTFWPTVRKQYRNLRE